MLKEDTLCNLEIENKQIEAAVNLYDLEIENKLAKYPEINNKINNYEIYKLSLYDFKELYTLIVEVFANKVFLKSSLYNRMTTDFYEYYGIRYDNKLVGAIAITDILYKQGRISTLAVDNDYRGKGIGDLLLNFVLKKFEDNDYNYVWLETGMNNNIAIKLYEKNGFKKNDQIIDNYNVLNDELGISMVKKIKNR
jgi:[ribosomal protein S18]-alanine N-acetyltransferase